MSYDADVVVVGAGPAGCAAAIWCALSGLRVVLLGSELAPHPQPGETLHPGVAAIFQQLGVREEMEQASHVRYDEIIVNWGGIASTHRFGDAGGSGARGFQILRKDLNAILLRRAALLGVTVDHTKAQTPVLDSARVKGVHLSSRTLRCKFVVDGSGATWLRRHVDVEWTQASRRLVARYGYASGQLEGGATSPMLVGDRQGWVWTAPVSAGLLQWTRLTFLPTNDVESPPHLADLPSVAEQRASDVTWRCAGRPAGLGYFLAGDAASVLDPASGRGVLHALMSGMMAAHLIHEVVSRGLPEGAAIDRYTNWIHQWFRQGAHELTRRYALLDATWRASPLPARPNPRQLEERIEQ